MDSYLFCVKVVIADFYLSMYFITGTEPIKLFLQDSIHTAKQACDIINKL